MKLATYRDGTIDGTLLVVSRDLSRAESCADIAPDLLTALQNWDAVEQRLRHRAAELERGSAHAAFAFDQTIAAAPLPRAPQLLDGSTGTASPENVYTDAPVMYQGTSDDLLGPYDDVVLPSEDDGIDFEAEIIVVTAAIPMGISARAAAERIRLIGVMNDVSLRNIARAEIAAGFGLIQAKPRSSFAPVAVTPDELGAAWHDGRLHLPVSIRWNGRPFDAPNAAETSFSFGELIAHAACRRTLSAGTIVGSGTISNTTYARVGSACIAGRRMIEAIDSGAPQTAFMRFGDRVRIEVLGNDGLSVCGAIDQRIVALARTKPRIEPWTRKWNSSGIVEE